MANDCTNDEYFETVPIILFIILYGILLIGIVVMFWLYIKEKKLKNACNDPRTES
jgi:hypothetical protein